MPTDRGRAATVASTPQGQVALPRGLIFGLLCVACLIIASAYAAVAMRSAALVVPEPATTPATEELAVTVGQPTVVFRSTALGESYGKVVLAPLDEPSRARGVTALECERVHFAAGRGLCLAVDRGVFTVARAVIFDEHFHPLQAIPLQGVPSRTRLSPDGRHGAATTFVSGHSYAVAGFSTETTIFDLDAGTALGTLEEFAVWRHGVHIQAPDFNFWGVTFARDGDGFYATLATAGKTYLVAGSLAEREVRVIHDNVECPSLSPDETRVAFKRRIDVGGPIHWQPYVLDLASLAETPLAEARTIDDQVEWLDDDRVLYGLPESSPSAITHLWVVPADGSGQPNLFLERAASPAVMR
jgi:hypothetical protein